MDLEKQSSKQKSLGTEINLDKLFKMQEVLDNHIMDEHPELKGQDNLEWKILALQVELGECANEWRGFKKWSNRQTPKMYPQETCDYCGEDADYTRPTPFMGDIDASMCKACWDSTKEEYAASNGEYIPAFEDYPHFSKKRPIKLLEEYVDCLHFILSIGLELDKGISSIDYEVLGFLKQYRNKETTITQFLVVNKSIIDFLGSYDEYEYIELVSQFLGLGEMLGFTWEEIEQAYFAKNKVNHARQDGGY